MSQLTGPFFSGGSNMVAKWIRTFGEKVKRGREFESDGGR
jgi:hypothetical protein